MDTAVIINKKAGGWVGKSAARQQRMLAKLFAMANLQAQIYPIEPDQLVATIQKLKVSPDVNTIIFGGGDGTLSTAAGLLLGSDIAIGVLPLGTFNYFAYDLGMPLNVTKAVKALTNGVVRPIDVGEMNGHIFINKVSLGIHPHAIEKRKAYQARWSMNKRLATSYALLGAVWRSPPLHINLQNGQEKRLEVPFIILGNNQHEVASGKCLQRRSFDKGHLSVLYTQELRRLKLFKMCLRTFSGLQIATMPELERLWLKRVTIKSEQSKLKLSIDGEIIETEPPFKFRIHSRSLRIIMP